MGKNVNILQNVIVSPEISYIVFIHFKIGKCFFNILVILSFASAKIKSYLQKFYIVVKTGKLRVDCNQRQSEHVFSLSLNCLWM